MLDRIKQQFPSFTLSPAVDITENAAAVLLALVDYPNDPAVILTQRAGHLNSHPGQVSFPGGKYEPEDENLLATALRETHEEIGLSGNVVQIVAELPAMQTRYDIGVKPFLGIVEPGLDYRIDRTELDAVFEVPLEFFMDKGNLRYQLFDAGEVRREMPYYRFNEYTIWGFTLTVLVDFLNHTLDAGIVLQYPRPSAP